LYSLRVVAAIIRTSPRASTASEGTPSAEPAPTSLADTRLAEQHDRVGAMTEDLQHLLDLLVSSEDRRQPVLLRQHVQVGCVLPEMGRELESLLQLFVAQLQVARAHIHLRYENLRIDAVLPNDRHGHARCLLQHRDKEIGRVDHQTAVRLAW